MTTKKNYPPNGSLEDQVHHWLMTECDEDYMDEAWKSFMNRKCVDITYDLFLEYNKTFDELYGEKLAEQTAILKGLTQE